MMNLQVKLKKQPQKYLAKVNRETYEMLRKALRGLEKWKGYIVRIGNTSYYRLKIPHYRIIFEYNKGINVIEVEEINTRTNIKYRRYSK